MTHDKGNSWAAKCCFPVSTVAGLDLLISLFGRRTWKEYRDWDIPKVGTQFLSKSKRTYSFWPFIFYLVFSPRNQQHSFTAKPCWIWGKGFLKTSQVHLRVIRQLTIKKQTTTKISLMKVLTPHILGPKSTLPISSSGKRKVLAPFKLKKWFYACLLWTLKPLSLLTWGHSS